jgi:organic radical activating enzyme
MKHTAIISLFTTCTLRCGFCDLAESGQVLDSSQLKVYRDEQFINRVADFFNNRTTSEDKWQLIFTGGEPLISPKIDLLCNKLFEAGNSVAFYTSLHVGKKNEGWRLLTSSTYPQVSYVMASLHPEAELWEDEFFDRVCTLKQIGHKVIVRYVGHPMRLDRLDELAEKCGKLDVCFFPTTLLTSNYPMAYSGQEREDLKRHFSSLSQFIQLEGGIDTTNTLCHAGSSIIAIDMQSGNITPCVTVEKPIIGNIHLNELSLFNMPIKCPKAGVNCLCDIHYEEDIVIGAECSDSFENQKNGYVAPLNEYDPLSGMRERGLKFYVNPKTGLGENVNEKQLIFSKEYVKSNYYRNIHKTEHSAEND